jgi:hypothetical protein
MSAQFSSSFDKLILRRAQDEESPKTLMVSPSNHELVEA